MTFILHSNNFGLVSQGVSLSNPGAETGDATGWTQLNASGPQSRTSGDDSITSHSGSFHFSAAASAIQPYWGQTVTLPSELETLCDAGRLEAYLSAWRIGFASDTDKGYLLLEFLSSGDVWLGGRLSTGTDPTGWTLETLQCYMPPSTRKIRVAFAGIRDGGTQCSAYIDDISLLIGLSDKKIFVLYADDTPEVADWTQDTGGSALLKATASLDTTRVWGMDGLTGGNNAASSAHKDISIPAGASSAVSAGDAVVHFYSVYGNLNSDDQIRLGVQARNSTPADTGSLFETSASPANPNDDNFPSDLSGAVATDAITVRLLAEWARVDGTLSDAYFSRAFSFITIPA